MNLLLPVKEQTDSCLTHKTGPCLQVRTYHAAHDSTFLQGRSITVLKHCNILLKQRSVPPSLPHIIISFVAFGADKEGADFFKGANQ